MAKRRHMRQMPLFSGVLEDEAVSAVIESSREESCESDGDLCAACYLPRSEHNGPEGECARSKCKKFR